jgi:hypothetical protein
MTRAPIARANFTTAPLKDPVAGAMMMVSPGLRSMSLSPLYGTVNLKEVSFESLYLIQKFAVDDLSSEEFLTQLKLDFDLPT